MSGAGAGGCRSAAWRFLGSPLPLSATRNKVLAAARCDEGLSLRDLMRPERARVLRVLSSLVNLQKFKVEKQLWYQGQEEKKVRAAGRAAAGVAGCAVGLPSHPSHPQLAVAARREALEAQLLDCKRRSEAERCVTAAAAPCACPPPPRPSPPAPPQLAARRRAARH